jgi:GAF domain-containing protein
MAPEAGPVDCLPPGIRGDALREHWRAVRARIESLLEDEDDWVSVMATVACEVHRSFEAFHWTGFYRTVSPGVLAVGPYQGGHGCLRIPFERGVCGAAARLRTTQRHDDVHLAADHIACSSTTVSEIVVPVFAGGPDGPVLAVLDIDSDLPAAFGDEDQQALESLCDWLGRTWGLAALPPCVQADWTAGGGRLTPPA